MFDIRKVWKHADCICLVAANQELGFLCGYVLVPMSHPVAGMSYDDIHSEYPVSVHGGLTFAQRVDIVEMGNAELIHLASGSKNMWMVGFDCGHAGDAPFILLSSSMMLPAGADDHVWDFDDVTKETDFLAEQLDDIA